MFSCEENFLDVMSNISIVTLFLYFVVSSDALLLVKPDLLFLSSHAVYYGK